MGEITEIVELYIEDSDVFENKVSEMSKTLETNIKNVIGPGSPAGYDTGHLHDSVVADYEVDYPIGIITGWHGADYGKYWYRWKDGVDFLRVGLEETVALYK